MIEREILEAMKAAKIRLRFDKVALRLISGLQTALVDVVSDEQAVIFTVTAPIRHAAKTAAALEGIIRDAAPREERCDVLYENICRIRWLTKVPAYMPKVIGFVHSAASDAAIILALAEAQMSNLSKNTDA